MKLNMEISRRHFLNTVGAGALIGLPGMSLASGKAPEAKKADAVRDVPMFRGNPTHTFYGTGPIGDKLTVKWKHKMGSFVSPATAHRAARTWTGTGWTGTAIYVGGKVIVGSLDTHLYCFDAATGKVLWKYKGGAMFKSSACHHDGRIFLGNVDNRLHCVDIKTGKKLWRYNTGRDLDSSPCVYKGKLYFGGENGYLHCMEPAKGKVIWRKMLGGLEGPPGSCGVESSPAARDGRIYASRLA